MMSRAKFLVFAFAGLASLSSVGCGSGSGSVYVGVATPGPWVGYPGRYPGMYPGGGVWVGVPVCCEDRDAMAEPAETTERYAESDAARQEGQAEAEAAVEDERRSGRSASKEDEGRRDG
jgi:hypothetical protein